MTDSLEQFLERDGDDLDALSLAHDKTREGRLAGRRFQLEPFADITIGDGPEWLVDDIVPAAGFTVIYGEAGCGKSFLASDLGLAVALGQPWAGKDVQAGTVVYVTAEGASGFRKRLVAYRQHYNISGVAVPFHVIADTPDLGHKPGDVSELIGAIETQAQRPFRAIFIDTLARTMAGADENSAADMGIFAETCARIGQELNCAVVALHHCGKDGGKGARGSSALRAAADCEIMVDGSQEQRTATVSKAKDGEEGWTLSFQLGRVEIEADDIVLSSCILEPQGEWTIEDGKPAPKRKLSPKQRLAVDVLSDLAIDGKPLPASWGQPDGLRCVAVDAWRSELTSRGVLDAESSNPRARWQELKTNLLARKTIGERDGMVWRA